MSKNPDIFAFTDYRKFLKAALSVGPRSYQFLATKANCSKALVANIIVGKRKLTPRRAEDFANALALNDEQTRYLLLLVATVDADTESARLDAWVESVGQRRHHMEPSAEQDLIDVLGSWWVVAILEMAELPEFQADPEWVSNRVYPTISVEKAAAAMELLLRVGALRPGESGRLEPGDTAFVTRHVIGHGAVARASRDVQLQMMELAAVALNGVRGEYRHYTSMTVAIPFVRIPQVKQEIARFQERVDGICHVDGVHGDAVYQLSLQLFPLSVLPDHAMSTKS